MAFYIFYRHRVCLVDWADLIYSLCILWEGLGFSSLACYPWVSIVVLCPPMHIDCPLGLLLTLPWRTWVCPCEGQLWRCFSFLGHMGSGRSRYSEKLMIRAAGNKVLQKGMATSIGQYAEIFLPGEPP